MRGVPSAVGLRGSFFGDGGTEYGVRSTKGGGAGAGAKGPVKKVVAFGVQGLHEAARGSGGSLPTGVDGFPKGGACVLGCDNYRL